jgi:IS30 family transposase
LARNRVPGTFYDAIHAGKRALEQRAMPRRERKLVANPDLFRHVTSPLREGWSPEQIAGNLKSLWPDAPEKRVSHETIYNAIYVLPRGELRKELIASLRQEHSVRRPRSRGQDRRGKIADMVSIHQRPPEIESRLVPGHWEGDLIKGAANASSVGTLVERTSRLVVLVRMADATAPTTVEAFAEGLNRVPAPLRKSMTYDQGREMSRHKELAERTGVDIYFADPHSPWQRGSNENTNGLLRQYLPKGTDLSVFSQAELDAIAWRLNTRPRKALGFKCPVEVFIEQLILAEAEPHGAPH